MDNRTYTVRAPMSPEIKELLRDAQASKELARVLAQSGGGSVVVEINGKQYKIS